MNNTLHQRASTSKHSTHWVLNSDKILIFKHDHLPHLFFFWTTVKNTFKRVCIWRVNIVQQVKKDHHQKHMHYRGHITLPPLTSQSLSAFAQTLVPLCLPFSPPASSWWVSLYQNKKWIHQTRRNNNVEVADLSIENDTCNWKSFQEDRLQQTLNTKQCWQNNEILPVHYFFFSLKPWNNHQSCNKFYWA